MYKDRQGNIVTNDATPTRALKLLYGTVPGRLVLKPLLYPFFSNIVRAILKSRISTLAIDPFIKANSVSLKDNVPTRYKSFNDFFIRRLKNGKRIIERDENLLASPCDSKVSVFKIDDETILDIKGSKYSVSSLLRSDELAAGYKGGWCLVLRLTVDDYHHYCYPDDGHKSENVFIPGLLHTVSPAATEIYPVYTENQREYTVIDTLHFGRIVQMEVGAMCVGRIVNLHGEADVKRGDEKGYFEFGGSTIVLLLNKEYFTPDSDLTGNTADGFETIVKMGERIGFNKKYQR